MPIEIRRLGSSVDYQAAWMLQQQIHDSVAAGGAPTVLLLEHNAVYTAGKRTEPLDRPFDGTPVIDVDRGGRITWHGPGQIVGYPIVPLTDPVDVVAHVRRLEELIIRTCSDFGLQTGRVEGRSGVWVRNPDRKVAAIGVRVSRGVTMHGFALNCNPDLAWYDRIVPCGIRDATVTSLTQELGRPITVAEVQLALERHLLDVLVPALPQAVVVGS